MKNTVRITSGTLKGRNLKFFPNASLRPTKNILVEALGSILKEEYQDAKCLDLFCGSGLIGLHFYSWGAAQVHLVDDHKPTMKVLQKQLINFKCETHVKALCFDVLQFLDKNKQSFDIVYMDPPYDLFDESSYAEKLEPIIKKIAESTDILCIEKPSKTKIDLEDIKNLFDLKDYKYGSSSLIIGRKKTED